MRCKCALCGLQIQGGELVTITSLDPGSGRPVRLFDVHRGGCFEALAQMLTTLGQTFRVAADGPPGSLTLGHDASQFAV